jgi:penicillin amidase
MPTRSNIGLRRRGPRAIGEPNDLKGLAPAPGGGEVRWAGFIPYEALPRAYNPADGAITTANHRITPQGYPHYLTSEWQPPYRANRIKELLGAVRNHSVGSFARIQGDVVSLPVRVLLPRLAKVTPKSEQGRRAMLLLREWDGAMLAERA